MSQQTLPCTYPPPKKNQLRMGFFSHRCLVLPKLFLQRKIRLCRRHKEIKHKKRVWGIFTKIRYLPTSHYMIHIFKLCHSKDLIEEHSLQYNNK